MSEENQPDLKQDEAQNQEVFDKIGQICEEHNISVAVFLALSEDKPPVMWWKGNFINAGEIAAKFVRLVKEQVLNKLQF